jgi:ComF family protein
MLGSGGPPGRQRGATAGWRAVTRVLRSCAAAIGGACAAAINDLVNVLFPSVCRVCEGPMLKVSRVLICEACVAGVVGGQSGVLCSRCGEAMGWESARFARSLGLSECTMCRLAPPEFARAVAFAEYDNQLRDILQALKFAKMRATAEHVLGSRLAEAILQLEGHAAADLLVVPVPLSRRRQSERGYNQAELLARAAMKDLRRTRRSWKLEIVPKALIRVKDTPAFFGLTPAQRRSRIQGAFRIAAPEAILGREVLLIDDIMTTGATARECSRVLLRGGATKVWVATVARAQRDGVSRPEEAAEPTGQVAFWDAVTTAG